MKIILYVIGIILYYWLLQWVRSAEKREATAIANEFRKRFSVDENCHVRAIRETHCFSSAHHWCFIAEREQGIGAGFVCVCSQWSLKTPWRRAHIYSDWFYDPSPACAVELLECCRDIDSKEKSKRVDLTIRDGSDYALFQDNVFYDDTTLRKSEARYFGVTYAAWFISDHVELSLAADHFVAEQ